MLKYWVLMITCLATAASFSQTRSGQAVSAQTPNTLNFNKAVKTSNAARAQKLKMAYYKRAETLSQTASMSGKVEEEKIVTGSVAVSYSQSLIDHKDGSKVASQSILASIRTKLSDNWGITTRFTADQNLRDSEDVQDGMGDVAFILGRKPVELADWVKGGPSFSTILPVAEYTTKYQNLQTILGASYTFALTPAVLAKGFELSLNIGATRNFHKYETDVSGRILNQYSMRETLSTAYSIAAWTFSADFIFRHAWNYSGSTSQAFEHSQEVGYSLTPTWGMSLGHTNSGSWLRPNGQDSNFKLINEDASIVYVSTSLSF